MGAAFLKDFPSKIVVFGGQGVQETLLKAAPKGIQKRTPKKHEKVTFWGSVLASFWVSWAPLGPSLGHLVAVLPLLGPRGPKREAQESPRAAQELPKRGQERPKRGQERAKSAQGDPKRGPREPKRAPREPKAGQESPKKSPRQQESPKKRNQESPRETQKRPRARERERERERERKKERKKERDQEENPSGNPRSQRERRGKQEASTSDGTSLLLSPFSAFLPAGGRERRG